MNPERKKALDRVRELVLGALADADAKVYLFGSCANDTARHHSDIDVAIDPKSPLSRDVLANLREALEESTIPYEVELVDLTEAAAELREHVRREGVVWKG